MLSLPRLLGQIKSIRGLHKAYERFANDNIRKVNAAKYKNKGEDTWAR